MGVHAAKLIDGARRPEYSQETSKLHEEILKSDFNTTRILASTNNGYIKWQENQIAKVLTGEKATSLSLLSHPSLGAIICSTLVLELMLR